MAAKKNVPVVTHFLNVDLNIYSSQDLRPLVSALGKKVIVLYLGRIRRSYCAHLELAKMTRSADSTIKAFCALIRTLPKLERDLWDAARVRDFSIGVAAGRQPASCDFPINAETIGEVAGLASRIVFTVYAPQQTAPDPSSYDLPK